MFDLRKFLEGAVAQVNPWDSGKTWDSVYNAKPQQPQRPQPQQQQPQQQRPQQRVAPNPLLPKEFQMPQPRQQTPQQPKVESLRQGYGFVNDIGNAIGDFAKGTASTGQKVFNTLAAGGIGLNTLQQAATDKLTNNPDYQKHLNFNSALLNNTFNSKTITGDQGTFISKQQAQNRDGNMLKNFIAPIGATAAEVTPWVLPYGKIAKVAEPLVGAVGGAVTKRLAGQAGASVVGKIAGKTAQYGAEAGITAPIFGSLDALNQASTTGQFNPAQSVQAGLQGGAFVAGGHAVGDLGVAGFKGAKKAGQQVSKAIDEAQPKTIAAQHPEVLGHDTQYSDLGKSFDTTVDPVARRQISQAMADNRLARLETQRRIERQIVNSRQSGSVPASNFDPTGRLGKDPVSAPPKPLPTTPELNSLNPTGGLMVDYNPKARATAPLGKNMASLDKTTGGSPDDMITIYRGAPKNQKEIAAGDFITDMPELAQSYTGDGNVISMKVRKGDVIDDITESGGNEYIYRPQSNPTPTTPKTEAPTLKDKALTSKPVDYFFGDKASVLQAKADKQAIRVQQAEQALGGSVTKNDLSKVGTAQAGQKPTSRVDSASPDKQISPIDQGLPAEQRKSLSDLSSPSKVSPNTIKDTLDTPLSKVLGDLKAEADPALPTFNAVAGAKGTNSTRKLSKAINENGQIARAAKKSKLSGETMDFFAKKDPGGRSVGVEKFNPKYHKIEAGFVTDRDGNILGNHIKVDETGIQVNVGGDLVNTEAIIGNPSDWRGKYKVSETMSRNIDSNAPNAKIAGQAKDYLVGSKVKAEANFRVELASEYKSLGDRIKATESAKPRDVSNTAYQDDIFSVLNGDKTISSLKPSYDTPALNAIENYTKETRGLYDSLLTRVNKERVKFGQAPIEPRKDYITHLQEMNGNKSFTGEVVDSMKNSFAGEGMQTTRGGVPGSIAGRTETFRPTSAYNKFLQRRTGTKSLRDPFKAVQEYLEPALYNIHMTESAARARAVESAFRTAGELKALSGTNVIDYTGNLLKPYRNSLDNGKLVAGFQEYANALGKKTQRWDRQIIDASDGSAMALKGWQGLQRVGGRGTILGNVSSVLAQPLNQAAALADAGPINYMKGLAKTVGGDKAINQSNFIKARFAKDIKPLRGKGEKAIDAGFVPLQKVEQESIKIVWNSQHAKALKSGFKGAEAIQKADYNTERLVAGRGIADKPELYRSTAANGFLQYTLEVAAQNKVFWKDLSPKQKITFVVAAYGMNQLYSATTGTTPLPDFLGAAIDTTTSFIDPNNKKSVGEKSLEGAKRFAGEGVGMNPVGAAGTNIFLSPQQKKNLFGSESDLGRYEGTAAPIKVVQNAIGAGESAAQGNWTDARNKALKVIPYGNQAKKSITGVEANIKGYAVDKSGKPTFGVSSDPLKQAQNVLFGPTASSDAKNYYGSNMSSFSQKQTDRVNAAPASQQKNVFDQIFKNKVTKSDNKTDQITNTSLTSLLDANKKRSEDFKNSLSDDDYQIAQLSKSDQNKLVSSGAISQKKLDGLNNYVTNKKKELGYNSGKSSKTDTGWADEYKTAQDTYNKDNASWSPVTRSTKEKELRQLTVKKDYSKDTTNLYDMAKKDVYQLVSKDPNGQKYVDDILKYGDALVAAGLTDKNKYRDKYGNVLLNGGTVAKSGGKGRRVGKGSRGGKAKTAKLPTINTAASTDTFRTLSRLLAGTTAKSTQPKQIGRKVVLKKITRSQA